jgi:hypothetical protein
VFCSPGGLAGEDIPSSGLLRYSVFCSSGGLVVLFNKLFFFLGDSQWTDISGLLKMIV